MNQIIKRTIGATLLEILLVLAVAAMVIIMSVRYYQSAQSNQQANDTMSQIQAIASGMDNLAQGGPGSYTTIAESDLTSVIGSNNLTTVTGGAVDITNQTATTYDVSMVINAKTCEQVVKKLQGNVNIATNPCNGGTLTYTYDSTK